MKISKTLLIPIFLMIGSCCCTIFEEEIAYLNNVAEVTSDVSSNLEDSMVLDEVFGSDFGMDTVCEDFYRAFKEYLSTLVDKNGDGIIDSEEMEDKPLPDIMTASLMYSSLDMDGDGEVTHDEASHCLLPFFERFLDLEKLSELNPKMAIIIEKTMTDFFNEQVESFVEELEEIALDPEVTFDHDGDYTGTLSQEDSVIPTGPRTLNHDQEDPIGDSTGPRAPTPLKEERDL